MLDTTSTIDRTPIYGFVVHFLDVHKSIAWTGACHAKDFPLASDYRPDYGPE